MAKINFRNQNKKTLQPGAVHPGMGVAMGGQTGKLSNASRPKNNGQGGFNTMATPKRGFFKTKYGAGGEPGYGFFDPKSGTVRLGVSAPKKPARIIGSPFGGGLVGKAAKKKAFQQYAGGRKKMIGPITPTLSTPAKGKSEREQGNVASELKGGPEYSMQLANLIGQFSPRLGELSEEESGLTARRSGLGNIFEENLKRLREQQGLERRQSAAEFAGAGLFSSGKRGLAQRQLAQEALEQGQDLSSRIGPARLEQIARERERIAQAYQQALPGALQQSFLSRLGIS